MKNIYTVAFLLASFSLVPNVSHALVRELALCSTEGGDYTVAVQDNQGIGFRRVSRISATITRADGTVVGAYPAELYQGFHSMSFGRPHYQDTKTRGGAFLLEGPSSNFRHYSLHARTSAGLLADDHLRCSVFVGTLR